MDILNNTHKDSTSSKPDIEKVEREKQEYKMVGKYLRTRGLNLYAYDSKKDEIYEIEIQKESTVEIVSFGDEPEIKDTRTEKATINTNHTLFESLNMKNARGRVEKFQQGKIKDLCNLREPSKDGIKFY